MGPVRYVTVSVPFTAEITFTLAVQDDQACIDNELLVAEAADLLNSTDPDLFGKMLDDVRVTGPAQILEVQVAG